MTLLGPPSVSRDALSLWRGPPLADFTYESFAQDEIRRLEDLRLQRWRTGSRPTWLSVATTTWYPSSSRSCGSTRCASGCWGELLVALYRCGRQADALDAYRSSAAPVRRVAGGRARPGAAAARARILEHDPSCRHHRATLAEHPPRQRRIGRRESCSLCRPPRCRGHCGTHRRPPLFGNEGARRCAQQHRRPRRQAQRSPRGHHRRRRARRHRVRCGGRLDRRHRRGSCARIDPDRRTVDRIPVGAPPDRRGGRRRAGLGRRTSSIAPSPEVESAGAASRGTTQVGNGAERNRIRARIRLGRERDRLLAVENRSRRAGKWSRPSLSRASRPASRRAGGGSG